MGWIGVVVNLQKDKKQSKLSKWVIWNCKFIIIKKSKGKVTIFLQTLAFSQIF